MIFSRTHYDKAVLHPKSQFSYSGGKSSCTYCSLEASIWLLRKLVFEDDPNLKTTIEKIIKTGVGYDKQLGHRSCDEAFNLVERFQHSLVVGDLYFGRIKKDCYFKLLTSMEQKASGLSPLKEKDSKDSKDDTKEKDKKPKKATEKKPISVVLTKPPETILIFHDPSNKTYPFVIFDSHPRSFELYRGAGFYFFKNKVNCSKHLDMLFPPMGLNLHKNEYEAKKYDTYEANYVELRGTSNFMTATTYEHLKPKIIKASKEEEDRDIISSIIMSQINKEEAIKKKKEKLEDLKKKKQKQVESKKKKEEEEKQKNVMKEEEKKKKELESSVGGKIELSEKKILLETIKTLKNELKKSRDKNKEIEKKLIEQNLVNDSLNQINKVSKLEIEDLKKEKEKFQQIISKINEMTKL